MLTGKRTVARGAIAKPHGLVFTRGVWRWEPSARWRAAGHKGFNLTNADGSPMDQWQAIERAAKWNEQLTIGTAEIAARGQDRTFDALGKSFLESARFLDAGKYSQRDYRYHIKRLSSADNFGGIAVPAITQIQVENHFSALQKKCGVRHGKALYVTFCALMKFAVASNWIAFSPCTNIDVKRRIKKPVPRAKQEVSKVWTAAEVVTTIRCAEWLELPCQADAIVLALVTGQSKSDILRFPNLLVHGGFVALPARSKTGVVGFAPSAPLLLDRLDAIKARRKALAPGKTFDHQLIATRTGRRYITHDFTHMAFLVRLLTMGDIEGYTMRKPKWLRAVSSIAELPFTPLPSLAPKRFSDLRTTALSRYTNTGGPLAAALIGGHSLREATGSSNYATLDANYYERTGAAVAATNAHHAFDDIHELLRPRPRPVKVA